MNREVEKALASRAVELGRSANPDALPELAGLLQNPSSEVRRLAVSAIGKLGGIADPNSAALVAPLLRDSHPQVRQYAVKALKAYGRAARDFLPDIRDMVDNVSEKDYNRRDAAAAIAVIEEAIRMAETSVSHACQRCNVAVSPDEYSRSQKMFQRVLCDHCFDETYIRRRNFDTRVEVSKTISTAAGQLVQSGGEKAIADWLAAHDIACRYDDRLRILEGRQVRPDFYLPELDVYIEYWGMDTLDYRIGMLVKKQMYQHSGKRLISVYPKDLPQLDRLLSQKLALLGRADSASAPPEPVQKAENKAYAKRSGVSTDHQTAHGQHESKESNS